MTCKNCGKEIPAEFEKLGLCSDCALNILSTQNSTNPVQESKEVRLVKTYNRSNVVEVLDVLVKLIILAGTIGGIILFLAFLLSTLDRASLPFNQLLTLIIAFILMALSTMLSASLLKAISEILDTLYDIRDKPR